jgi:outer membrane protein
MLKRFFVIFGLFPLLLQAQHKWTLEECINYALKNSIQLQQQQISVAINKNNLLQSRMSLLPSLSVAANHNYMKGHTIDPFTNEFIPNKSNTENFSVSSSVTLFNGFRMLNSVKYQKFNFLSSLENLKKTTNTISLNIASAFLQVLYSKENLELAKKQYETNKVQVDNSRKLYEAGSVSIDNLLDAKAQLANSNLQVITSENNLKMAILTLVQLMNLSADSLNNFDVTVPDIEDISNESLLLPLDTLVKKAVEVLPDYKAAEYNLKSKEYSLKMAQGSRSPRVFLSLSYGTGYSDTRKKGSYSPVIVPVGFVATDSTPVYGWQMQYNEQPYPFSEQLSDNMSATVSLGVSIPIFSGYQTSTQIKNARLSLYSAKLEMQNAYNNIYKSVVQAYSDAKAALNKFNAAKKSLEAQKKSFENISKKFSVGLISYVDFNIAKNNLFKAENDLLQAKYEYVFKLKILDFYIGKSLNF